MEGRGWKFTYSKGQEMTEDSKRRIKKPKEYILEKGIKMGQYNF